ncbi:MAG: OFA family MFS transporter [Desulfitobacteriia bacterium]|jgi:OFA family oxalate/formate antiporter-like MFS transporter
MGNSIRFGKWTVLCAAVSINIIIGILYIWSIISKALINDWHWTGKEASLPYTVAIIAFVLAMTVFGKIQDIKGPRFTTTISGILLGGGLILSSLTTNPKLIVLTFGIITGSGVGIAIVSTLAPAIKWFPPEKKGMITGITVAGIGVSSIIYSPVTHFLIENFGVSKTFLYMGIVSLVLMVGLAQFLVNPPEGYGFQNREAAGESSDSETKFAPGLTWKEMLKTVSFYKLWIMFAFSASAGLMVVAHAANIAKVQINWEGGFYMVIMLSVFNTIGRFFGGSIADRIGWLNLMRIVFILPAINMLVFSHYNNVAMLAFGISVVGFCYGATYSVFPAALIELYGMRDFGANYGLVMTGWGLGGVIGPMVAAYFLDSTKTYYSAYLIASVLLIIVFIITFTFRTKKA